MEDRPSVEQVLTLASDPSSALAARALANPAHWQGAGATDELLWGDCQGSAKRPYRTFVDLNGPAYQCSCPSRKFPCKHALGLMLLFARDLLTAAEPPADTATWAAGRAQRADRADAPKGPPDPEAAAKRATQRAGRVRDGLLELDRWLRDQVRTGLAGVNRKGYGHFDQIAARMVDAQAPAVAGSLRSMAGIPAAGRIQWPGELLEQLAMTRLLVRAHVDLDRLPVQMADTVRARVGYPFSRDDVLAGPPVRDQWLVIASRDSLDTRLTTRRVWLRGSATGRVALVLSFAPTGQPLDASLTVSTVVDADLHFYPGGQPLRALVGVRHADTAPSGSGDEPVGAGIDGMLAQYGAGVAADPWLQTWPVVLRATPALIDCRWLLLDGETAVPLVESEVDLWRLLAISGGTPVSIAGEWNRHGFAPLAVWHANRMVAL